MKTYIKLTWTQTQQLISALRQCKNRVARRVGETLDNEIGEDEIGIEIIGPDKAEQTDVET